MEASDQHDLNESLAKLETALLTPVVSGELEDWVRAVQKATAELRSRLDAYLGSTQRRSYFQIAKADSELLNRVQQLASDDQTLLADFAELEKSLDRLAQLVSVAKRQESRPEEQRSGFEQQGLALILRIRKHVVATDTWLSEALYRDRGVVD